MVDVDPGAQRRAAKRVAAQMERRRGLGAPVRRSFLQLHEHEEHEEHEEHDEHDQADERDQVDAHNRASAWDTWLGTAAEDDFGLAGPTSPTSQAPGSSGSSGSSGSVGKPPMAALLSGQDAKNGGGGRGGRTRLALYLTLLWVLSGRGRSDVAAHSSTRPWRVWAELLGLGDPAGTGTRAVRSAARELDARGLITHEPSSNSRDSATLVLLREDASREAYSIPNPNENAADRYLRVPEALWTQGLLARLTGPELAMYLIALDLHRTDLPEMPLTFSKTYISSAYGLGDSSRRKGLAGLVERDILFVDTVAQDSSGDRLGRLSPRNIYTIAPSWRRVPNPTASIDRSLEQALKESIESARGEWA